MGFLKSIWNWVCTFADRYVIEAVKQMDARDIVDVLLLATVLFLWFLSESMLEKLDRIKVKYGLLER